MSTTPTSFTLQPGKPAKRRKCLECAGRGITILSYLTPELPQIECDACGGIGIERADFVPRSVVNTYDCEQCKAAGIEHEVQSFRCGMTNGLSCWGAGVPTTMRVCSGCGRADGPWVSADLVGGGW